MIRWRFISIRLLVVVLVLLLLRWSASPIAEWFIVYTLQNATGAKVEIAATDVGLFPPRIRLTKLVLADPGKEMRNAFEAEDVLLTIDGDALLRRRYEISDGRITGIRIGGDRETSGALDLAPEPEPETTDEPSAISQWCQQLAGDAEENIEAFGESLATVRTSKEIRDQWEARYESLRQQAQTLEDNVRVLKSNARSIDNPLRDLPALQETLRRAEEIKKELLSISQQLDAMPAQVRSDMVALEEAREQDRQRIRSYLPASEAGQETQLGPELLASLVRDQIQQVRDYLQSGQAIADATVASPKMERIRGEDVLLGGSPAPAWLVRRCELSGYMEVNSEEYQLVGVLENFTTDHLNQDGPLHARMRLDGPRVVRIDYQRDYSPTLQGGQPPRDHLKIHWPNLPLPSRKVGKASEAALVIDGGQLQLWVDIETQGDKIEGRLVSRQEQTSLGLTTKDSLAKNVFVQSLNRSLAAVDHVDVDATFKGTWREMDLQIATSLTDQLKDGMTSAINESLAATQQKLANRVDEEYRKQSLELERWLGSQQTAARELLAKADEAVTSMSKKLVAELGAPDAYLGRLRGGLKKVLK